MFIKDKIIFGFLTIFTLGIYPIIIFTKKPKSNMKALSQSKKIITSANELINTLGGHDNIQLVEHTHTRVKVFLKNTKIVDADLLKKLKGVSGIFISSKYISIVVGNQAKQLAQEIK